MNIRTWEPHHERLWHVNGDPWNVPIQQGHTWKSGIIPWSYHNDSGFLSLRRAAVRSRVRRFALGLSRSSGLASHLVRWVDCSDTKILDWLTLHTSYTQSLLQPFVLDNLQCTDQDRKLLVGSGGRNTELHPTHAWMVRRSCESQYTGCTEGFFRAENCNKNMMKSINTISLFCILKSVIKFKLFQGSWLTQQEKIEFNYTF